MNTAKKTYSLISAIVLVLLSVLMVFATVLPLFKINMATVETAEMFENGTFTEGLIVDEANIGLGSVIGLIRHRKYINIITKVQRKEQQIVAYEKEIATTQSPSDTWLEAQQESIDTLQNEIDAILDTLTDTDYDKIKALLSKKSFVNALYAEIGFISIFSDTATRNKGENYIYNSNLFDVVTVVFGMIFLALFILFSVIFTLTALFSALRKIPALITDYKDLSLRKLETFPPKKAMRALFRVLFFYTLTKLVFGSGVLMGAGLLMAVIISTVVCLIRITNKLILRERRNPLHIARALVGLASFILAFIVFLGITNMNLVESYRQSNEAYAREAYAEAYEESYLTSRANNPFASDSSHRSSAESYAKNHVTQILSKNAFQLFLSVFLTGIFAYSLLSKFYKRLFEIHDDYKGDYGAQRCSGHYVLPLFLLLAVLFTSTLGVNSIDKSEETYLAGGVKIVWNDHSLEDSPVKEECDTLTDLHTELTAQIKDAEAELKNIDDPDDKADFALEIAMAKRLANKLTLRINTLKTDDLALRKSAVILLAVIIVLEVIYRALPKVISKYLPESVKYRLIGRQDEYIDTSMGPAPAPYYTPYTYGKGTTPSTPPAPAPKSTPAPAPTPAKQATPPSSSSAGSSSADDLADEMQRMFDSRK